MTISNILTQDLLIEIGCEELPPKSLMTLSAAFKDAMLNQLTAANLTFSTVHEYATPRRLALVIESLQTQQEDHQIEKKGPPAAAGMKDGQASPALLGFAKSCGVDVADLQISETEKGAWYTMLQTVKGGQTANLIPAMVEKALSQLPIAKRMRWADNSFEFVRPLRWLVLMLGDKVINAEIFGVKAGDITRGHRFHTDKALKIPLANQYAKILFDQGFVIADPKIRQIKILEEVEKKTNHYGIAVMKPELLEEVTALVEWPVAMVGEFETRFLDVPQEALISTMQDNQKYFPIVDKQGKLQPKFCFIANIDSKEPQHVIHGNERVIRPRFSDAEFFWNTDKKVALRDYLPRLEKVIFQAKLGSQADKMRRTAELSAVIAQELGANVAVVKEAALLSKCDLLSNMVQEFPELQGIMGRYYAIHEQREAVLADCLEQIYWPKFAGDQLPISKEAQALAIAERLDTITGIFAIGQIPTGSKDPYSLRRSALGILRIIIENQHNLDIKKLIEKAVSLMPDTVKSDAHKASEAALNYILERMKSYIMDKDAVPADTLEAVTSLKLTQPLDITKRITAVTEFRKLAEAKALSNANKRIENILRKNNIILTGKASASLLEMPEEKALFTVAEAANQQVNTLIKVQDYAQILKELSTLAQPLEQFFDKVMVMCEDEKVRNNRLELLTLIRNLFQQVADISALQD